MSEQRVFNQSDNDKKIHKAKIHMCWIFFTILL